MLRITSTTGGQGVTRLALEGSLAGPWVEVFRSALQDCHGSTELDLSAVQFVDADGLSLLRALGPEDRVTIVARSGFVASSLRAEP
jgi:ABC-type transporter Mla MlaB component